MIFCYKGKIIGRRRLKISIESNFSYLAHISDDHREQTLEDHCKNVGDQAASRLKEIGLNNTGYLAGCLHDIGKYSSHFQRYLRSSDEKRGSVNHTFAGARLLLQNCHARTIETQDDYTCELLAYAIASHHGLIDCVDQDHKYGLEHRKRKDDPEIDESIQYFLNHVVSLQKIKQLFKASCAEMDNLYGIIKSMANENENPQYGDKEIHFYLGLVGRLILSSVIDADRNDTANFMKNRTDSDLSPFDGDGWRQRLTYMESKLNELPQETEIQRTRREISDVCRNAAENEGGIYRFHAPTGSGKTLSSLRYALAHAAKWNKHRIVFTSPLLSILEQNARVIRDYIGNDEIILEHHSNLVHVQESQETMDYREMMTDSWNAPVIITTLVQLLDTMFGGKTTQVRRFCSLCNSVIIIDEVQTIPKNMLALFNITVNFLAKVCNTTFVLCSATQPCLEIMAHPIIGKIGDILPYEERLWKIFERTEMIYFGKYLQENIPDFVRGKAGKSDSLLVVCNKKSQAEYLFSNLLETGYDCYHLSAGMCIKHRQNVLENIEKSLQDHSRKTICISTQVIEAGVDISFDQVIRLSAGLDSIIQAAGRCNRNGEKRMLSPVYILDCEDENLNKLREIQTCKCAMGQVLFEYQNDRNRFHNNIGSEEMINLYYQKMLTEFADSYYEYKITKQLSLFDLLSEGYSDDNLESYGEYGLKQAFKTAGKYFKVFDENTDSVIVPYGEGKEIINELLGERSAYDLGYREALIEKGKRYFVNVYQYQKRALEEMGGLYMDPSGCVLILKDEFYDQQKGIIFRENRYDYLEV